jgi:peptidoglycan/xylan/chitin deacetylase (PgdA/CDA1 family)
MRQRVTQSHAQWGTSMWPDGKKSAVAFSFDFDAESVWIGDDPKNADRPGVLSQGTYGAKVAIPLILDLLARRNLRATFFVPGIVAERYGDRVRSIVAAGHELAHHGYTHTSPANLSAEDEEAELVKGLEVLRSFTADIVGYRSPSWDFSPHTIPLLQKHGFRYSSNLMDDIRPYRHEGSPLVEIPIQWILDDAPHFWFAGGADWTRRIATNEQVRSIWGAEFAGIHALGGCTVITMHPQIIGRPGRLSLLDEFIGHVQDRSDVWVATCTEIATRV